VRGTEGPEVNKAAQSLGRLGGKARSKAKTLAARQNAKKGGWRKGKKRKTHRSGSSPAPESNDKVTNKGSENEH